MIDGTNMARRLPRLTFRTPFPAIFLRILACCPHRVDVGQVRVKRQRKGISRLPNLIGELFSCAQWLQRKSGCKSVFHRWRLPCLPRVLQILCESPIHRLRSARSNVLRRTLFCQLQSQGLSRTPETCARTRYLEFFGVLYLLSVQLFTHQLVK